MNAYELANKLEDYFDSDYDEIVTMLRQQQAEIEALKNHELTDEEIYRLLADSIWAVGLNTDCLDEQNWADGITVARAILRKASEK